MSLARLDNEVIFKKAFTDNFVFRSFVHDILGIDIDPESIETQKSFYPKTSNIDIKYDIFAEDTKKRVIVEIQRVYYDYNYDRFLHYHLLAIIEQQRSYTEYRIGRTVYTIVIITAPYKKDKETGEHYRDEVLISKLNPRNLLGQERKIYNHEMLILNPNYKDAETPSRIRDWLDLIYESIHHPDNPKLNLDNKGVKRASELVEHDNINPVEWRLAKEAASKEIVLNIKWEEGIEKGEGKKELEVIKNGIKNGFNNETIASVTGISIDRIQEIRENMGD